jgi:Type II secretory pathway, component PulD
MAGPLGTQVVGSNLGGLSLGGSGLSLTFDSAGETRALVNAFYNSDRAQIRSSPKLLVKSGTTGSIEVGNEIPILTSNRQSTDSPGAPVIQNISYRKTGVLLTINPLVQASGLVDLIISQELSEQQATGIIGSPTILTRKIDTALALSDGGSVLLGGLISNSNSDGQLGVPPVGRIPLIGKLFRVETRSQDRTELIMLVSTYVVRNHDEAKEITEILKNRMKGLE